MNSFNLSANGSSGESRCNIGFIQACRESYALNKKGCHFSLSLALSFRNLFHAVRAKFFFSNFDSRGKNTGETLLNIIIQAGGLKAKSKKLWLYAGLDLGESSHSRLSNFDTIKTERINLHPH